MTTTFNISCEIDTTDASVPLDIAVFVDGQPIFDHCAVDGIIQVSHDLPEDEGEHELRFVMQNKLPEYTTVDNDGTIVKDARIIVRNISFDDIPLGQLVVDHARYTHNFNGTGEPVVDKFYGEMGCNGTVSLKFSTPIYLWLLENM
jgi:hypothetical protein